jgi:hypothetical protein
VRFAAPIVSLSPSPFKKGEDLPFAARFAGNIGPRSNSPGTARAQVSTLRERFLKIGVQVVATVRRVVLHLPQAFPYRDHFHRLALSLGAQTG